MDKDTRIKILVVGDPGTGKSSLVSYWFGFLKTVNILGPSEISLPSIFEVNFLQIFLKIYTIQHFILLHFLTTLEQNELKRVHKSNIICH